MAELNIAGAACLIPPDSQDLNTLRIDIRVSSVPTIHGESIVMRLLTGLPYSCR